VTAELERRVLDGCHSAGFVDIRAVHANVFRLLPPEGCRITELAERTYSSKQAIGYLVEYLEDHGYEVNRMARQLVQQIQDEWAKQLGEERMESLIESLRLLVNLLGVPYTGSISEISTRGSA
jgi:hypothetical protein